MPSNPGPLVKICGISNLEDGRQAVECGADLIGFVMAPSPRRVAVTAAAEIVGHLRTMPRGSEVLTVGVFKDAPLGSLLKECRRADFDVVQLHGKEPPEYAAKIAAAGFRVMKVIHRIDQAAAAEMKRHADAWAFLLEPEVRPQWRGTGECADFSSARAALGSHPRVGIAGNLSPLNVRAAIAAAGQGLWMVDAASALESVPGVKNHELVKGFIEAARGAR